jgi:hypothetical protein
MRGMWNGLGLLTIVILGLLGCHTAEPHLRPPKQPEQFTMPPDDRRFQEPPVYPGEVLNKDLQRKRDQAESSDGPQGGPKMGMGRPGG